jgi:tubulin epsilon
MKARALLVDMECGPLQETMRSNIGGLFEETQFVMDVYGSGNNFANGNRIYGPQYRSHFEEGLRKNVERCSSLQSFFLSHSLGGGTGSGVGTYILSLIDELYPKVCRFTTSVFPSEEDDVITSPYNSILASSELIEHGNCVFPLDNHALQAFAQIENEHKSKSDGTSADPGRQGGGALTASRT